MFPWVRFLVFLVAVTSPGCSWLTSFRKERAAEILERSAERLPTTDRIVLDFRLIDQPAGDPFATDRLWTIATNPLPHDQTALLAENGLRVGVVSGIIPADFTERVSSERHAVDPRAVTARLKDERVLPIRGPLPQASLVLRKVWQGPPEPVSLSDAEFGLAVTPMAKSGETISLRVRFAVQSGSKESWLRPSDDKTRFVWDREKGRVELGDLRFDVSLARGDILIVGPSAKPFETMGEAYFFDRSPGQLRQRFFVLRTSASQEDVRPSQSLACVAGR
jgi:hypothetical protein